MININDKLIRDILPKIGSDAYAVMSVIASHLGKNGTRVAWPGIERIRKMATVEKNGKILPMSVKRCRAAIRRLISEKCLERWQDRPNGDFGKTKYKLTTAYIGIYMGVNQFEMQEEEVVARKVDSGNARNGNAKNGNAKIDHTEVINEIEGINKLKDINKKEERENALPKEKTISDERRKEMQIEIEGKISKEKEKESSAAPKSYKTSVDVRKDLMRMTEDSIENRAVALKIYKEALNLDFVKTHLESLCDRYPKANIQEVIKDFVLNCDNWYSVRQFKLQLSGWVRNSHKDRSKSPSVSNEKRFDEGLKASEKDYAKYR